MTLAIDFTEDHELETPSDLDGEGAIRERDPAIDRHSLDR